VRLLTQRFKAVLLIGSMAFAVNTFGPPANAEIPTCGAYHNSSLFDGYSDLSNDPNYYEGAAATLVVRRGSTCDTDTSGNNSISAWSMIAAHGGTGGYSQSGYYRAYGTAIYHFAQYRQTATSAYYTKLGAIPTTGSSHLYKQQSVWNAAASQWQIRNWVDSTLLQQTNFDTFNAWAAPFSVQWFGETKYAESDVPGTSASPANFSGMQVQIASNDAWTSSLPSLAGYAGSSRYHHSAVSGNAFTIWTG
jgi:hypothetical protein